MKRTGNLWNNISSLDNIEYSIESVLKNKKIKPAHNRFLNDRDKLTKQIHDSLIERSYIFSSPDSFVVFEPKKRIIHHAPFYPDKILHHCLMNSLRPIIMNRLTSDSYGSIKGRGITQAIKKMKESCEDHEYSYFLKLDIKKFYEHINHKILKEQFRTLIKCRPTLEMIDSIIDSHNKEHGIGLPIGYYTSQYFSNFYMSKFDHWVKEDLKVKYYFRYVDDMIFFFKSKSDTQSSLKLIIEYLDNLGLSIHDNYRIAPISTGIDFIGYKFYPTHTLLRKSIKLRMKKRLDSIENINDDKYFKLKTAPYYGWCQHANCKNLLKKSFGKRLLLYMPRKNND